MNNQYDEQLIISAGLNIKLSNTVYLKDLLRIEYMQETRKEIGLFYLQYISKNTNYAIFDKIPDVLPESCIVLMQDWSLLIKSKFFTSGILISPLYVNYDLKIPIYHITLNHTKCVSYKVLGLAALFLSLKDPTGFVDIYKNSIIQEIANKTMIDIKNLILIQSRVPYKTILLDLHEAKELLRANVTKSHYSAFTKPVVQMIVYTYKLKSRKIDASLYDINENSESLEYSPTQELSETSKTSKKNERLLRFHSIDRVESKSITSEELTHKKSFFFKTDLINSFRPANTPIHSPKQSTYSISEIKKFMFSIKDSQKECTERQILFHEQVKPIASKTICSCVTCSIF